MDKHQHPAGSTSPPFWRRKTGVVLIMLIAIGAFYGVREHFTHVYPYLPYLILLICPLMHFLGMDMADMIMAIRQQPTRTKNSYAHYTEPSRSRSRPRCLAP